MPSDQGVWTAQTVAQKLRSLKQIVIGSTDVSPLRKAYRQAAAMLVSFEPSNLKPFNHEPDPTGAFVHLMNDSIIAPGERESRRWMLKPEVRRQTVKELGSREMMRAARQANSNEEFETLPSRESHSLDSLQSMMDAYLLGHATPIESQTINQLTLTAQVVEWFASVVDDLPDLGHIQRLLERKRLSAPFEYLTGDRFRGRTEQLRTLREYVGVLEPQTVRDKLSRQFEEWRELSLKPPLVIHGLGGIGKSTLVAKFILEHLNVNQSIRFPFVYLDFDSPYLLIDDPTTLLVEATKQLKIQYPDQEKLFATLQQALEEQALSIRDEELEESSSGSIFVDQRRRTEKQELEQKAFRTFGSLLHDLARDGKPVRSPCLLVLDTFEEVQHRSANQMQTLRKLLEMVQNRCPTLRIILSGRNPVTDFTINEQTPTPLPLGEFDLESAQGFLASQGVLDESLAKAVFESVGGSPLNLMLAAHVVKTEGADKNVMKELRAPSRFGLSSLPIFFAQESVIQGQLYRRILGPLYVHNEDVRKLAHPGLVLRRITPKIIRHVLAGPCDVQVPNMQRAEELFEELKREVTLVNYEEDGSLRHRQDVRRVMLNMLSKDKPDQVRKIHEAAARFYVNESGPIAKAEEIYHRLQLSEDLSKIEQLWEDGAARYLWEAVDELPVRAQAYLATKIPNLPIDEKKIKKYADLQEWEEYVSKQAQEALNNADAEKALTLIRERTERTSNVTLYTLEIQALALMGRLSEAKEILTKALEIASTTGHRNDMLTLLQLGAEITQRLRDYESSDKQLAAAEQIATQQKQSILLLDIIQSRLQIRRQPTSPADLSSDIPALSTHLAQLFVEVPEKDLSRRKVLVRQVVGEVGGKFPQVLERGLKLAGFRKPRPRQLQMLADGLANACQMGIKNLIALGELLARTLNLELQNFELRDTWLTLLKAGTNAGRLDEFVQRIIREVASSPTVITRDAAAEERLEVEGSVKDRLFRSIAESMRV